MKFVVPKELVPLLRSRITRKEVEDMLEEAGYITSISFDDLTSHPTSLAGYGITDAKIVNGTITLGTDTITPITSETDPTVPAWAKASTKPNYNLDEVLDGTTRKLSDYALISSLGTAAYKNFTTSILQDNADLPTAGAVYSAIAAAVTSALHYRGMSSTAITDGGTETATISGQPLTPQAGDVVIYNGFEFLWENNVWNKLGDDSSYALKTITVSGDGTYITGGGDLTATRTLTLSAAVIASLGKADTALQSSALDGYVNEIATGTGNYISGVSKSGKKLTFTYGTLPTTIAWGSVTGKPTTLSGYGITDAYTKTEADTEYAKYLPLAGNSIAKSITGNVLFANGTYLQGVTTGIEARNLIGYNTSNQVVVGNTSNNLYLVSVSTADLYHTKGSTGYKIYDASNLTKSVLTTLLESDSGYYLPLTAGSGKKLTGDLHFNATSVSRSINWTNSSNVSLNALYMANGQLFIGYNLIQQNKAVAIFGGNVDIGFGTSSNTYSITAASGAFRPKTDNNISLGTSSYKWSALYATTLYGNLALSYLTGADDLKAIEALTETSGFLKKTAANTWALTNDIEATSLKTTTEEDAMFTYRHTPSVALGDMAKLLCVKGNTIIWNQLIKNGDFSNGLTSWSTQNGTATIESDGTIKFVPNNGATGWCSLKSNSFNFLTAHKYYCAVYLKKKTETSNVLVAGHYLSIASQQSTDWQWVRGTCNVVSGASSKISVYTQRNGGATEDDTFWVKYVKFVDLTVMGLDSLTAEQFEALYPLPYYNYDSGSLQSNKTATIESVGFNQWDEEWENGKYNTTTGEADNAPTQIRSKNYIPVFGGTDYYFQFPLGVGNLVIMRYDIDKNYLGYNAIQPSIKSLNAETRYIRFYMTVTYGTTYKNDICINLSDANKNGTYEPYWSETKALPITTATSGGVAIFSDGMKSAGTAYDEMAATKATKRIGVVDMGSLSWSYSGGELKTSSIASLIKAPSASSVVPNVVCVKYVASKMDSQPYPSIGVTVSGNVCVRDSAYTDAATFKAAMSGVMLYYELATPEHFDLLNPIPQLVACDPDGTQRRLPEDTASSVSAPMVCDFQYGVNPSDIIKEVNSKLELMSNTDNSEVYRILDPNYSE